MGGRRPKRGKSEIKRGGLVGGGDGLREASRHYSSGARGEDRKGFEKHRTCESSKTKSSDEDPSTRSLKATRDK